MELLIIILLLIPTAWVVWTFFSWKAARKRFFHYLIREDGPMPTFEEFVAMEGRRGVYGKDW